MNLALMNPDFTQYKGYTYTEKLINQIYKYIKEDRIKNALPGENYLPASLVATLKDGEVKQVACSLPNDIMNDNLGIMFAAIFKPFANVAKSISGIFDTSNVDTTFSVYGSSNGNQFNGGNPTGGSLIQIGTGTTLPTRSDRDIEVPFASGGIEDTKVFTDQGTFLTETNQVQVGKLIAPTFASGIATETCLFSNWKDPTFTFHTVCLSRDLIGSLAFGAGESVSVRYFWSF